MAVAYIVLHDDELLAVYTRRKDVVESFQLILEMHSNKMEYLSKFKLFRMQETMSGSGVFNRPRPVDIEKLIKEEDYEG